MFNFKFFIDFIFDRETMTVPAKPSFDIALILREIPANNILNILRGKQ